MRKHEIRAAAGEWVQGGPFGKRTARVVGAKARGNRVISTLEAPAGNRQYLEQLLPTW